MRVYELTRRVATLGIVAAFALFAGNAFGGAMEREITEEVVTESTVETTIESEVEMEIGTLLEVVTTEIVEETTVESTLESVEVFEDFALVLEINQTNNNTASPHHNTGNVSVGEGDGANTVDGTDEMVGITQIQQSIGIANVSVATNALIAGDVLVEIVELEVEVGLEIPIGIAKQKIIILSPALQFNSLYVTKLLLVESLLTALSHPESTDILDAGIVAFIDHDGNNEYSPHNNSGNVSAGAAGNFVGDTTPAGLTQIQQQIGVANVGLASNVVLFTDADSAVIGL